MILRLQWRKVMSIIICEMCLSAYIFGPCVMFIHSMGNYRKVKRIFLFQGKIFCNENSLIRYVDSIAVKSSE
jgi:hypothetical protein